MAKIPKKYINADGVKDIFASFLNILNITTDTVQESLDLKADIDSPELTGVPTAPTAVAGTNSDQVATTAFVHAATQNLAVPPLATESQNGLMSASDKQLLDSFNPNISVSLTGLYSPDLCIINAKRSNVINLEIVEDPHISTQIRTSNLLDVSDTYGNFYISGQGAISQSSSDLLGPFMSVTPGDDIYFTGLVGETTASSVNRRLHVYDANQNWIKQLSFAGSLKVGETWSTHGVIPNNGAYVRVSWGTEDTNIMVSVGAPTKYMPYYITPFTPITSSSFMVSTNAEHTDAITYTVTLPPEADDVYGFEYNPVLGKIYSNVIHIDSYNGETLPNTHWWSDRDTFAEGTSPSIGAEVIYIIPDQESAVEYDIEPMTIPLFYRTNYITPSHGIVDAITYYAETLSVNHLSIESGITFGSTDFTEEDIASWKHAGELIDTKAPIDSPVFTGGPTAPNPGGSSNSTRIATTKFVQDRLNNTLAPVETNTNSASKSYAVGDYLIYNGQLYKVTTEITAKEAFASNIVAVSMSDELKAKTLSVNDISAVDGNVSVAAEDIPAEGIGDKSVTGNPITIEDGMASVAKELSVTLEPIQDLHGYESPWIGTDVDKQPYLFRAVSDSSVQDKGTHEMDKLIGGTVAWNQLLEKHSSYDLQSGNIGNLSISFDSDGYINVTGTTSTETAIVLTPYVGNIPADHVVLYICDGYNTTFAWGRSGFMYVSKDSVIYKHSALFNGSVRMRFTADVNYNIKTRFVCFDLTQMFGSTIADYIYSLEQSTAGAGVAFFRNLFPAPYYPYNAGELISVKTSAHVMRGFNQWDEEWLNGYYNNQGVFAPNDNFICSKNPIPVLPNTVYYIKAPATMETHEYDADMNYIGRNLNGSNITIETGRNTHYLNIGNNLNGTITTYNNDICINVSKTTGTPKNGDYVAYDAHTYPLDSDLELRGIPKLDSNNNLYYDGDIYEPNGSVTRKYGVYTFTGTEEWTKKNDDSYYVNAIPTVKRPADANTVATWAMIPNLDCSTRNMVVYAAVTGNIYAIGDDGQIYISAEVYNNRASLLTGNSIVYELATHTTETADPFTSIQVIDPDGTEEYVDTRTVPIPVGHESNYANICPIEGRTGTEVQRTGKNLLDMSALIPGGTWGGNTYSATISGGYSEIQLSSEPINIAISRKSVSGTSSNTRIKLLGENHELLTNYYLSRTDPLVQANVKYLQFDYSSGGTLSVEEPMIRKESIQDATFEPYSAPDTASISCGQTVYGGQVDFVTGKCRVTLANIASYNGETIGEPWWSSMDEYVSGATPTIGAQVVYTLATPIELTLTPAQLSLLQGTNILTADGTINLTYLGSMASNVQDEIDEFENNLNNVIGSIAFIENSTAKTSHVIGDYIILNGIFCKIIAPVSTGETLSFGTNVQATTIAAELKAILAQISA